MDEDSDSRCSLGKGLGKSVRVERDLASTTPNGQAEGEVRVVTREPVPGDSVQRAQGKAARERVGEGVGTSRARSAISLPPVRTGARSAPATAP